MNFGSRSASDPPVRVPRARARDIVQLAEQAGDILARAREAALAPGTKKVLRKFNLKEVAELIGVSAKTITRAVQRNELPAASACVATDCCSRCRRSTRYRSAWVCALARPGYRQAVVVAIANFKGGVGKTSTAIHLGQHFALRGYRVLMIDLDAQASLTTLFGLLPDSEVATEKTALPYSGGRNGYAGRCHSAHLLAWSGSDRGEPGALRRRIFARQSAEIGAQLSLLSGA